MKLVRDNAPDMLKNADPTIVFEKGFEGDRVRLLINKMHEEVGELLMADDREKKLKELGDLQELLWAFAKIDKISEMEIFMQAQSKRTARGEFDQLQIMRVQTADERPSKPSKPKLINDIPRHDYYPSGGVGYSG